MRRRPGVRSPRVLLVVILGLCFFLRAGAVVAVLDSDPHVVVQADTPTYEQPALALLEDGEFSRSPQDQRPEFLRTPGYPAFIATVYLIFGQSHAALLLMQVFLSTVTVLVVYLLGARMWSVSVGLLAAAMTVFEPLQWYSAGTMLSESLDTLLLMLVVATGFIMFTQEKPKLRWPFLLGIAIATATMVRPVTYYLPLFVIALVTYQAVRRRVTLRHGARMIAVFLLPVIVIIGGWQLRNHEAVNSWRFSAVEAKNLDLFRAAGVVADEDGISLTAAQRRLITRLGTHRWRESRRLLRAHVPTRPAHTCLRTVGSSRRRRPRPAGRDRQHPFPDLRVSRNAAGIRRARVRNHALARRLLRALSCTASCRWSAPADICSRISSSWESRPTSCWSRRDLKPPADGVSGSDPWSCRS